jgi:hypothetical protein
MRSVMRNATIGALIYEFLFDVYRLIEAERKHNLWLPDENGVVREAFDHRHTSCWEWSTSVLEEAGVTKTLGPPPQTILLHIKRDPNMRSPFSYPLMTLDECRVADFSRFETFDNYCYAMFTFWQSVRQMSGRDGVVNLAVLSPRFLEAVATKDDIFLLEGIYRVKLRGDRFEQKVMTRWREMDLRVFRRKEGGGNCAMDDWAPS